MQEEVLSKLRDVHLPQAPSWWPPALGYYLVFLMSVLIITLLIILYRRTEPARLIKKQLMLEVKEAEEHFLKTNDKALLQAQVASIVRRILAYKKAGPALLSTELSSFALEKSKIFPNKENTALLFTLLQEERYQKEPQIDGHRLIYCARELVKKCRI